MRTNKKQTLAVPAMSDRKVNMAVGESYDDKSHTTDDGVTFTPCVFYGGPKGKKFGIIVEFDGVMMAMSEQLYKKLNTAEARILMAVHTYQDRWTEKQRETFRARFI